MYIPGGGGKVIDFLQAVSKLVEKLERSAGRAPKERPHARAPTKSIPASPIPGRAARPQEVNPETESTIRLRRRPR